MLPFKCLHVSNQMKHIFITTTKGLKQVGVHYYRILVGNVEEPEKCLVIQSIFGHCNIERNEEVQQKLAVMMTTFTIAIATYSDGRLLAKIEAFQT